MLQNTAIPQHQDWVLVVSVRCQGLDFATLEADLAQLTGEARNWVGGSASS
jgi:RNase P protein component